MVPAMPRSACFRPAAAALLCLTLALAQAAAQSPTPTPAPARESLPPEEAAAKRQSLASVAASIEAIGRELKEKQRLLKNADAPLQDELGGEVQKLSEDLNALEDNFAEVATGIDVSSFRRSSSPKEISWSRELTELVAPLLNELKDLTSRPREIDRLRTRSAAYADQVRLAAKGVRNIEALSETVTEPDLSRHLADLKKDWKEREQYAETQLRITEQRLEQKLNERKPLSESLSNLTQIFFKSRGRNLAIAVLATFLFWLLLRRLQPTIERLSRVNANRKKPLLTRLFNLAYLIASTLGAVLVFMAVLYLFEDWVLLILAVMLLGGVLWASKQAIPRFWGQTALLLNIGPVREHERVLLQGLPWRVGNIGFYTLLNNPALEGGTIRLHLNELAELRSRPYQEGEGWFPTKKGDWVLLEDGTYGRIERQTPETVKLILKGNTRKVIPAAAFCEAAPLVLSTGFRITTSFGFDYSHQAEITNEVLKQLQYDVQDGLMLEGYSLPDQISLCVEFEAAAASSLNVAVIADVSGEAADRYQTLKRLIARLCVDACNKRGWIMPFDQLTLHIQSRDLAGHSRQQAAAAAE